MASAVLTDHTAVDDLQGLGLGVFLCGLGIHFLTSAGLITGQTAGLAVIVSYLTGYSFGVVFFAINLPFYFVAYKHLGMVFTIKSLISVTLLSAVTTFLPYGFALDAVNPVLGAIIFGALVGLGLLAMFRHNASLGGLGVLALLIQDRTGFKAGWVQLITDAVLFSVAFFLFPTAIIGYSIIGALVLNLIIAVNHRRDRYIAT